MSSINEIITLLQAGYTKSEIDAMTAQPEQIPPEPAPIPAADPEPEPAPAPEPEPAPEQPNADYQRLEAKLNQFIGLFQNANLNQGIDNLPRRSAQDALAEVIAPPRKERK